MNLVDAWVTFALALLFLLASGCAPHVPISESAMFHDVATQPSHDKTFGIGIVGTYSPTQEIARELAEREYPERKRREDLPLNPKQLSGGIYLARFDAEGRYGISATVGALVAGVDATVQMWRRNYLTASVSVPGQGHVFLQHRAFNSPELGAAVGVGYRHDAFAFEGAAPLAIELKRAGIHSFGARGFVVHRAKGDTGGGIKIGAYAGYIPTLVQPLFSVNLTVGRF